ncbi:MAG: AraC-like DNA-binding protein [Halieaceae bacterium]
MPQADKNLLRLTLKEREPNNEHSADILNMSSRTLQRKLNAENTTLGFDQIPHELGHAESLSFYLSFKQWTGRTVGFYREATS